MSNVISKSSRPLPHHWTRVAAADSRCDSRWHPPQPAF